MPRTSIQQRINHLEERKRALLARLGKQERREDTRRKILIGALVLHRLQHSHNVQFIRLLKEWLTRELPGFLIRDGDRALFSELLSRRAEGSTAEGAHALGDESTAGSEVK